MDDRSAVPAAPPGLPRLSDFIRGNTDAIAGEWVEFARTLTPASDGMTRHALRDHAAEILAFVADDMETAQSGAEQVTKSQGDGPKAGGAQQSAAEVHAALRLADGFDLDQMVSEYRALRASVVKLWQASGQAPSRGDVQDLTRFHEAIDQAMTESIRHYTASVERSRTLFLGILSHDLRNPVGAASMAAEMLGRVGPLNEKQSVMASGIRDCTTRAARIITDLLDLTRVQLGTDLPIHKELCDLHALARQLVDEMRVFYPACTIDLHGAEAAEGMFDKARMGQVLSNLIGNGVEHGAAGTPVTVSIALEGGAVALSVRNMGVPIPTDRLDRVFEALVRSSPGDDGPVGAHLGLGLFIASQIVRSHGGSIGVESSADGTVFTCRLPRA